MICECGIKLKCNATIHLTDHSVYRNYYCPICLNRYCSTEILDKVPKTKKLNRRQKKEIQNG